MLVDKFARAWVRAEDATKCPLIVDVLGAAGVDHQPVSFSSDEVADQAIQADLPRGFVIAMPRARVDAHFDRLTSDRVRKKPPTIGLLVLEMQLALAGQEQLAHRAAKLADMGWVDDGCGDEVAAVPRRLVNEGVDGHWAIVPYRR